MDSQASIIMKTVIAKHGLKHRQLHIHDMACLNQHVRIQFMLNGIGDVTFSGNQGAHSAALQAVTKVSLMPLVRADHTKRLLPPKRLPLRQWKQHPPASQGKNCSACPDAGTAFGSAGYDQQSSDCLPSAAWRTLEQFQQMRAMAACYGSCFVDIDCNRSTS